MEQQTMMIGSAKFMCLIDDLSHEEAKLQSGLWGRLNIDYAIEKKSGDRHRFFISEALMGA